MGLWATQAKVEHIVLKAVWHWGRNCSAVNDPVGEPGRTAFYTGLLSIWGSEDSEQMFCPFLWEGSLIGDSDGYEWTNKPLALETKHVSIETLLRNMEGGSFIVDFEEKVNY